MVTSEKNQSKDEDLPLTILVHYVLLGAIKEEQWNPDKKLGLESGVKKILKQHAPDILKDPSGHPFKPKLFITDVVAQPGFRLIYVHPDTTDEQKRHLSEKLQTAPELSPQTLQTKVPNPKLMQLMKKGLAK